MPDLTQVAANPTQSLGAIHALIVGPSKSGKTDWVAQAAKDGYQILYFDADNGLSTLLTALSGDDAALKRIQYFNPVNFAEAIESLLTLPIFRYNVRTRTVPNFADNPEDRIIEIRPSRIPKNVIVVIDSWTTLCYSLAKNRAAEIKVSLTDIDKYSREIYGAIGFLATQFGLILQSAQFHVIVQAHDGYYERKEKPAGVAGQISEKDMIIRETSQVPLSTSMPHGHTLPKYFNQIGWTSVDRYNNRVLDFRALHGRIGGGTPNGVGDPRENYRFAKLFGLPGEYPSLETWLNEMSYDEMKERAQAGSTIQIGGPKAAAAPATPVAAPSKTPAFLQKK